MRLNTNIKERIIIALSQFKEYLKSKKESDEKHIISNILELTEKIVNYLYNNKNASPVILNNKIIEQINNDYYLVINNDIESNLESNKMDYSSLFLMNITSNSMQAMEDNS